jgi:hypothetical protein
MKVVKSRDVDFGMRLDEQTLAYLVRSGAMRVQDLYVALRNDNLMLSKGELTDILWRLAEQRKVYLEDIPLGTRSLGDYLKLWERNLWFYGALMMSVAQVLGVYALPSTSPFVALRWGIGSVFVFFIPGYVLVKALFPGRELNTKERFAISVGLSLVMLPLVGLLLNYTPWGITATSFSLTLSILTIGLAVIAAVRQYAFLRVNSPLVRKP